MSPSDLNMTTAAEGWYFVRVWDGEGQVNGLQRFPVGAWATRAEEGKLAAPLIAKPGAMALTVPDADDQLAAVGLCPPDREWQTYFPPEQVRVVMERWLTAKYKGDERAAAEARPPMGEVDMPGVGKVTVRDARPEAQRSTADWMTKAWGGSSPQRLPGS